MCFGEAYEIVYTIEIDAPVLPQLALRVCKDWVWGKQVPVMTVHTIKQSIACYRRSEAKLGVSS